MERRSVDRLRSWVRLEVRKGRGMLERAVGGIRSILGIEGRLMIKASRDGRGTSCDIGFS